jgi:plasmid stabilization system protein ParE
MVERIAWLDTAKKQYKRIMAYMFEHYSVTAVERFNDDIDRRLARLEKQPYSGRPSQIEGVRYVLLRKRWHLYYRFHATTLYVVFLWDSKQNPNKNPFARHEN